MQQCHNSARLAEAQAEERGGPTLTRRPREVWWLTAGVMLLLALVPEAVAATREPEDVVGEMVEASGAAYAGACEWARAPQDIGKVCTTFVAARGRLRAYLAGPTFSEYRLWVFVEHTPAGWRPAGTAPLDFYAPAAAVPWPR